MEIKKLPCGAWAKDSEEKELDKIFQEVKGMSLKDMATNTEYETSYARAIYTGVLKPEYRNIDLLKLAIICDNGYWFFGGKVGLERETGKFEVNIWTD